MSSEGDALGASYSRGERNYGGDATTLANPHVHAGAIGRPGVSFRAVSAWVIALVALWAYRRAVIRALQTARTGTLKPRAALVHVRSALRSCSAASRRRFAATRSAFLGKPSRETFPDDDPSDALEDPEPAARALRLAATVDPLGVEDGRWTPRWDVSPRPSASADDRARRAVAPSDGGETTTTSTSDARDEDAEKADDAEDARAATFPGVARLHARAIVRAAADVRFLRDSVPRARRFDGWRLLYCAARDGFSLHTLYRACASVSGPVTTLIEDERGGAFGAFTSDAWRTDARPYGDGRSFVFSLRKRAPPGSAEDGENDAPEAPTRVAYRWDPKREKSNYVFQAGRADSVSLGGGNGFALWLDGDLLNGASAACDTFGTPGPLSYAEAFKVRAVEVWGFEPLRRFSVDSARSPRVAAAE